MRSLLCLILLSVPLCAISQELSTSMDRLSRLPSRFFSALQQQSSHLESQLIASTEKTLKRLAKQEFRLKRKLSKKDSAQAEQVFGNIDEQYKKLQQELKDTSALSDRSLAYIPHFDTLKTSLQFLSINQSLLPSPQMPEQLHQALKNIGTLEDKLQKTEQIRQFIRERRQLLSERLSRLEFSKVLNKLHQQAYYYNQQLEEYKAMLDDPSKLQQKALSLIQTIPAFQRFMQENSQLASLFRLPENYGSVESLAGLQTRESVQSMLQGRIDAGGPNAMAMVQQNIQAAQGELNKLKDKLNQLGNAGDSDMPDFKPNNQKTKTFLQRLEYGTNLQSQRAGNYFPTTSDLGLSVGYKLNEKSIIGIGASYKIGWGKDIHHISVSSQGVGFRSFADYKIKGSFFASGGFEYNYQQPFSSIEDIRNLDTWQQSGLLGISKIVSLKSKLFKKTKLQLFWDFLSQQQRPQGQALKFRIGYTW